ncbi:DUF2273 domain-containing protein [Haliovirga abyssi]|uniref:DUF2273 domain-containing protein n=1 Tax=Haliovirga abyssi TaxID=2996794 RepID=A0AAU9D245_9FUSO|nr:DUF2273 domain-containing protein [Haliovirga abyssi]BDU50059.1 hypothetical protein HLVA_06280 [Haliovirga abyssi]
MEEILNWILNNFKKILGALIGFILGYFYIKYGFLKTLILVIFVVIGYTLGAGKDFNLKSWIIEKLTKGEDYK